MDMWDSGFGSAAFNNTTAVDNLTLSCAAKYIQDAVMLPYSTVLTTTVRALVFVYFFCIIFLGTCLNLLVIVLVAKCKKLQTHSFIIALQIVALDLMLSVSLSNTLVTSVANKWLFGEYVCAIIGYLFFFSYIVRSYLMLVC